jgi:hypothetical protein
VYEYRYVEESKVQGVTSYSAPFTGTVEIPAAFKLDEEYKLEGDNYTEVICACRPTKSATDQDHECNQIGDLASNKTIINADGT